jgi:hypothetical protein
MRKLFINFITWDSNPWPRFHLMIFEVCRAKSTELLDRPKSSFVKFSDSQEKIKSDILMTWNPFKTQRFKHLRARCRLHWSRKHAIKLLMLI